MILELWSSFTIRADSAQILKDTLHVFVGICFIILFFKLKFNSNYFKIILFFKDTAYIKTKALNHNKLYIWELLYEMVKCFL